MMKAKKNNLSFSSLAEADLVGIFLTSIEEWGINKAKRYSKKLEDSFNYLIEHPGIGKTNDELFPGALSFPVGSHMIYYRKNDSGIQIARVLHQRMNYQQHDI